MQRGDFRFLDHGHLSRRGQFAHFLDRRRRRAILVAPVHERDVLGNLREFQHPVERRIAAAENRQPLAGELLRVPYAVVHAFTFERINTVCAQRSRLEGADAGRDDHRLRIELLAGAGLDQERVVVLTLHDGHFLAEVHARLERRDLLHQLLGQLVAGAHGNGRNVVDGFVGIELGALTAGLANRIDDFRLEPQQAKLKNLEQAAGARADNDNIRGDHVVTPNRSGAHCRSIGRSLQIALLVRDWPARLC